MIILFSYILIATVSETVSKVVEKTTETLERKMRRPLLAAEGQEDGAPLKGW